MTPLGREIAETIAQDGPITVERYMALCLGHPSHGYYATRDPFGAGGDFVTAPEISQMFGELVGLWCAEVWRRMGEPARVQLIELGPGRGTLMADALRAAKAVLGFRDALDVTLVETSPTLREIQREKLAATGVPIRWASTIEDALRGPSPCKGEGGPAPAGSGGVGAAERSTSEAPPDLGFAEATLPTPAARGGLIAPSATGASLPVLVLANEFFDALPIRQFVRTEAGWRERMVGLVDGALAFGLASEPPAGLPLPSRPTGFVLELNPQGVAIATRLGAHLAIHGGAALALDYGEGHSAGDTLQAMRRHGFVDPLAEPGAADLTAQVDFGALARAVRAAGATTMALLPQADLLERLGLHARAAQLTRNATPAQAEAVEAAVRRLTDRSPSGMGALFKALAIGDPSLGAPPGFELDGEPR
ncbi:NADH dehydrogenase [ubiquinone] 1 alpha subcomplex assembly factor 7 [Methylopila capsulata]|uniref:ATP synthase subunit beta n=1 Tax=Methylopila capsulata TaxID=61654 RepID=A0A9W6ITN7_9HYPH|nr:SAM-dependent methyltransferase [Methylopila capsulata]MBM7852150.1 NADH dehydrogenase [ubiquinone] 1 alpha subcomplex assembly factor 7 [Methylopila capsulata]GLK56356.1 ATP synthase subunit beta [Methylopila capsulata]